MQPTILVAEDDAVMHRSLEELFELEGYEVISVKTLAEAMELITVRVIDGAVIDWRLGLEFTDPLLEGLVDRGIATVLLSGHPEARAVADGFGVPCVHKPFVVDQLLGIVSGVLNRQTLRRIAVSRGEAAPVSSERRSRA
jgi:DNA-binding NtrC family response regulator